ncbi:MAG: SAV_2336 N-terminal domain-related protein [Scytonema sp. PMC 1069.18]|nr:SAV_2336 N-terminal domain-related protein [Scytonema sp. PMC 1069.18]MEC4881353.1 SAV_2336 N-terminal domain-related protein [Scytonema sp. PMC 1070.18]
MSNQSLTTNHLLNRLITELGKDLDLTGAEISDILWLTLQRLDNDEAIAQPLEVSQKPKSQNATVSTPSSTTSANINFPEIPNATAQIYNQSSTQSQSSSKTKSLSLRVPDAPSLREPIKLVQALRPLMRRVASGRTQVLDEIATVERRAQEGFCVPVFKPEPEPWLDLALVVDESKSMLIWRHTIQELKRLLEHYGIFRDVRTWGLVVLENNQEIRLRPRIGDIANQHRLANPQELIDPTGRCLILVVSDCVAAIWRNGSATSVLKQWTNTQPVAILQMLPEWLWLRTGLSLGASVRLGSLTAGVANQYLLIKEILLWQEFNLETGIKIPVLTLEPEVASAWSHMVAGKSDATAPGFVFASELPEEDDFQLQTSHKKLDPQTRVHRFRMTASPMARKLAGLLAAAPVISLPVVRLVQETLLPKSRQVHVAEVFLGGLLKPLTDIEADTNPDTVQYEFMEDEIREILLESAPVSDSAEVLAAVSQYVASQLGKSLEEFVALLKAPEEDEEEEVKPFARVTAKILRQLGGDYARFAEELEQNLNLVPSSEETSQLELLRIAPWICYQVLINNEVDVTAICWSPDGKFIASGFGNGTIYLQNLDGNLIGQSLRGHGTSVNSIAFSPDSQLLVSGSVGGSIRLWNIDGKAIRTFPESKTSALHFVAFSPDGDLIISGSNSKTVRLWDIRGNSIGEPFRGHESTVNCVAFSPDGKLIASGSADRIRLWDLFGKPVCEPLSGHDSYVNSIAFSSDGQLIVSGSSDRTIRVWDLQGNPVGQPFYGHEDAVNCVAFRPDGQLIFSGSNDKTIRVWNLHGEQLSLLEGHERAVSAIAALSISVIAMSFSAIFIKISEAAAVSPNATIFNRLCITTLTLVLWKGCRTVFVKLKSKQECHSNPDEITLYAPRTLGFLVLLGLSYMIYQATWAWSLAQTSIAISTLLHNLTPVFMSLVAWLIFRQQFDSRFWLGMVLAVGGATELGLEGGEVAWGEFAGDLAALASAILFGVYLLTIDQLRSTFKATDMLMWGSLIGSSFILPILLINHENLFPRSSQGWIAVITLAAIQVIGQVLIIYSMDKLSASTVALFIILDPVLTVIEAWVIFSERLSLLSWISCCICLLGVYLSLLSQSTPQE